jgi:hypothetical protein
MILCPLQFHLAAMNFFFFLVLMVTANAQTADEIAYDLFAYDMADQVSSVEGGVGFVGPWSTAGKCHSAALLPPKAANFISFAQNLRVGFNGSDSSLCEMQRSIQNAFVAVGALVFLSFLLTTEGLISQPPRNLTPKFGLAVGANLDVGMWTYDDDFLKAELENDKNRAFSVMLAHEATNRRINSNFEVKLGGIGEKGDIAVGASSHNFFVVIKIETNALGRSRVYLQVFDADAEGASIQESLLRTTMRDVEQGNLQMMSIALYGMYLSQVRVGKTFASVYSDLPSALKTTTTTATTTTPTTRTPTQTLPPAINMNTTTTTTPHTQPSTRSALISAPTVVDCDSATIASCSTCLANSGCKWCATSSETGAGRCTEANIDECSQLVLAPNGCAADASAEQESLPVAIIAGATAGGVALLLIIVALIVCLVLRSRNQKKKTPETEMATARESKSIAASGGDNVYGDLQLSSVYSAAGLVGAPG